MERGLASEHTHSRVYYQGPLLYILEQADSDGTLKLYKALCDACPVCEPQGNKMNQFIDQSFRLYPSFAQYTTNLAYDRPGRKSRVTGIFHPTWAIVLVVKLTSCLTHNVVVCSSAVHIQKREGLWSPYGHYTNCRERDGR